MSGSFFITQQSNSGDVKEDRESRGWKCRDDRERKTKGRRTAMAMKTTMGERMTW